MASSKRREWTKIDVRELKSLAREKMPAGKIARRLKGLKEQLDRRLLPSEFLWIRAFRSSRLGC